MSSPPPQKKRKPAEAQRQDLLSEMVGNVRGNLDVMRQRVLGSGGAGGSSTRLTPNVRIGDNADSTQCNWALSIDGTVIGTLPASPGDTIKFPTTPPLKPGLHNVVLSVALAQATTIYSGSLQFVRSGGTVPNRAVPFGNVTENAPYQTRILVTPGGLTLNARPFGLAGASGGLPARGGTTQQQQQRQQGILGMGGFLGQLMPNLMRNRMSAEEEEEIAEKGKTKVDPTVRKMGARPSQEIASENEAQEEPQQQQEQQQQAPPPQQQNNKTTGRVKRA